MAFSNALSIAECVYNQPEISEVSKEALHHLKLDLVAGSNFAWRTVHNNMLMRRSVALDNLSRTIPLIDSDSEGCLTSCTLQGYYPFEGELAKLHRANKEHASFVTVYLEASPQTYSTKPYTGRGRSFRRVAPPTGEVAGIEIRVGPPLRPQLLNRPSHGTVKPP